jgi:hypothetical protein
MINKIDVYKIIILNYCVLYFVLALIKIQDIPIIFKSLEYYYSLNYQHGLNFNYLIRILCYILLIINCIIDIILIVKIIIKKKSRLWKIFLIIHITIFTLHLLILTNITLSDIIFYLVAIICIIPFIVLYKNSFQILECP